MVSRQVVIPFYRDIGRQRRRGFSALAHHIGRTANPFLHEYIERAATCAGAILLKSGEREVAVVFSGRRKSKTAAKTVGRKFSRKF